MGYIFFLIILFMFYLLRRRKIKKKDIIFRENISNKLKHVAFIMDGNRRWAKKFKLPKYFAYSLGIDNLVNKIKFGLKFNIPYMTFYCLSEENLKREKEDLEDFFNTIRKRLKEIDIVKINEQKVSFRILGNIKLLPLDLQESIDYLNSKIINEKDAKLTVSLAIGYSSRVEIINAVKALRTENEEIDNLTQEVFSSYLNTKNIPDPDLIIRTGGEVRLSNFLLWQASYSELFFVKKYWPSFNDKDLYLEINKFFLIKKNYGK